MGLLTTISAQSVEGKNLRARAIETIGSVITSIADAENKEPFKANVLEITQHLSTSMQAGFEATDPQD